MWATTLLYTTAKLYTTSQVFYSTYYMTVTQHHTQARPPEGAWKRHHKQLHWHMHITTALQPAGIA